MDHAEFEALIDEGILQLPQWVREKIRNVAILTADEPTARERKENDLTENETLLGLYQGVPLTQRGSDYGLGIVLPDSITLYKKPIEEAAQGDREAMKVIVADTIWHEFAHYFGMDEDAVHEKEKERGIGDWREWKENDPEDLSR